MTNDTLLLIFLGIIILQTLIFIAILNKRYMRIFKDTSIISVKMRDMHYLYEYKRAKNSEFDQICEKIDSETEEIMKNNYPPTQAGVDKIDRLQLKDFMNTESSEVSAPNYDD